jgi:isopentenyldiphosphate isomerase
VLTLLVQLDYEARSWFKIPASCFFPEPEVASGCVVLVRRAKPLLPEERRKDFVKIVKRAFSQRRKMMLKLLKADWSQQKLEKAFAELQLSLQERAEKLSLEQFVALTRNLVGEIFDIVNDHDEVIGSAPRSEVHARSLLHRAVHVLVFNARGEVFLQKRSMFKDRQPGVWDSSASGHVDSGEAYDACAVREVGEELGVALAQPPERLFKFDACTATDQEFVWVYRARHEGPFTLPPEEIERGGWFAPAEVTRWIAERPREFASAFVAIWQRLNAQAKAGR